MHKIFKQMMMLWNFITGSSRTYVSQDDECHCERERGNPILLNYTSYLPKTLNRFVLLLTLTFSLCTSLSAKANSFSVYLDKSDYALGEEINLFIETDGNNKYQVNLEPVEKNFRIISRRKVASTNIVNGNVTSTDTTIITLDIQKAGNYTIPSITARGKDARLQSQEIFFKVNKERNAADKKYNDLFSANFKLSDDKIYLGEHAVLTIVLSKKTNNIADESYSPPTSDNFIIEKLGEPKSYTKIIKNEKVTFVELNYLLIPLKSGSLNIDLGIYEVGMLDYQNNNRDPFANMFSFSITGSVKKISFPVKETPLEINVSDLPINESLPVLKNANISSKTDKNSASIGDPIEYVITVQANDIKADNLPEIILEDENFKIYPESPVTMNSFDNETLTYSATKSRKFILIANKAGKLNLPKYKFSWFDKNTATKKEVSTENLPLSIKAAQITPTLNKQNKKSTSEVQTVPNDTIKSLTLDVKTLLIIAILASVFLGQTIYIIYLKKSKTRTEDKQDPKISEKKLPQEPLKEQIKISDYLSLNKAVCELAQKKYKLKTNSLSELRYLLQKEKHDLQISNLLTLLKESEEAEFSKNKSAINYKETYQKLSKAMQILKELPAKENKQKFDLNP